MYATAGLPIARWADKRSRVPVIVTGLAFWSAMTAACGLAHNAVQMALARVGVGLGEAACSPPAHSIISDKFAPRRRGLAFAIYGLGLYIGMTAGLVLGGAINQSHGWRAAFIMLGLPGLALSILLGLTVREPKRAAVGAETEVQSFPSVLGFMFALKSFRAYALGIGLFSFAANAANVWSGVLFMRVHGMASAQAGAWTGYAGGIAGVVGTLVFGLVADWWGRRDARGYLWVPCIAIAVLAPATAVMLFGAGWMIIAGYCVAMACAASCLAPIIAITQELVPPRMRAVSSAVLALGLNLVGIGAGNFIVGLLTDAFTPSLGSHAILTSLSLTTAFGVVAGLLVTLYGASRLPADLNARGDKVPGVHT
jgi:MFS family permease